jgi:membrane-associated protein
MFFGMELNEVIGAIGVVGVAAIIFAESGLLIGFFFPGDTLLFAAGILAQQGVLGMNVHLMVFLLTLAAIAGVQVGYAFGKHFGRKLFQRPDSLVFRQEYLEKAEKFYEKYGPLTLIIARFTPVVRTFAPIVAGIAHMNYKRFLFYNIVGGIFWITSITYLGYYGGAFLKEQGIHVEALVMPVLLVAVLLSLASPFYHLLRDPKSRSLLLKKLRLKKD